MLFKLFDGSFCVSVLGVKWRYDSSYCGHFMSNARQTFIDFLKSYTYLYILAIWDVNKQYLFDWVGMRLCIALTIVRTFCSASQELDLCSYNICKVMKSKYLFDCKIVKIHILIPNLPQSHICDIFKKYFRFPRFNLWNANIFLWNAKTFLWISSFIFKIQLSTNSKV